MKKDTSFLIVSIFWMLIFNILIINFLLGNDIFAANSLITGAVVIDSEEIQFIPNSILKLATPLLILNFIILIALVIVYEKWVKEK